MSHKSTNFSPGLSLPTPWKDGAWTKSATFALSSTSRTLSIVLLHLPVTIANTISLARVQIWFTASPEKNCQKQYMYLGQTKHSIAQSFSSHLFNIRHPKKTNWCSSASFFPQTDDNGTSGAAINGLHLSPSFYWKNLHSGAPHRTTLDAPLHCPAQRSLNIYDWFPEFHKQGTVSAHSIMDPPSLCYPFPHSETVTLLVHLSSPWKQRAS